jgi:DNA-binding HxlR family transcriptional regulator
MTDRSYGQFCALASALDVIGERWTLLIIRELLPGPRRYKDLLDGLPGISTNLLSERLKRLEELGVLGRRTLPPPAGSNVYELTAAGRALEPAVLALGRWGSQWLPASLEGCALPSLGTLSLALKAFFHPEQARGVNDSFELRFGEEALGLEIVDGALQVQHGQARQPAAILRMEVPVLLGLFTGRLAPDQAQTAGLVQVDGDPEALSRFLRYCHVPAQPEPA